MIYKRTITEKVKIKNLFDKLGIKDEENSTLNIPFPIGVKTPYGFKHIKVAFRTEKQRVVTTYFKNNKSLKTSENHLLKVNGEWKKVRDIETDDIIETKTGTTSIVRKHYSNKEEILYDISVADVHCYYSNGIVSHNSWFLAHIGAEAIRQGKNVMHFTMELGEKYVGRRYDAIFSKIAFQDVCKFKDQVKKVLDNIPIRGRLFVKYYPMNIPTAATLKAYVERLQLLTGVKIDMMIVDYADLLRPSNPRKNSNSYEDGGSTYGELRSVLGELQIPGWSASQANRGGHEEEIVGALNVADSYKKIMIGDFIMSLSRMMQDKLAGTGRILIIKSRFGSDGKLYPCKFDASCGDIGIYDEKSVEGMEILSKAKSAQENIKDILRKRWKETHGDGEDAS